MRGPITCPIDAVDIIIPRRTRMWIRKKYKYARVESRILGRFEMGAAAARIVRAPLRIPDPPHP